MEFCLFILLWDSYMNGPFFFCQVWSIDKAKEEPYSLLPALQEGFFSDITIKAGNGKKVYLCSCSTVINLQQC